jgi:hypothetical protein
MADKEVLVVHWAWPEGSPHHPVTFWGCHDIAHDGRIAEWQRPEGFGLVPLAAVKVTVTDGADAEPLASLRAMAVKPGEPGPYGRPLGQAEPIERTIATKAKPS